jgi:integrase
MYRVFFDTCVWFAIAEEPKRFPFLAVTEEMVRRKAIELIVPDLALKEFRRRRADIAHATETNLRPHIRAVREASAVLGWPKKKHADFLARLDELLAHGPIQGGGAEQALDRVERLLKASELIEDSDAVTRAAVERRLARRAPDGLADSILFETYAQCVREGGSEARFAFVTHNKHDFSYMQRNENLPHPDLADAFADGKSYYFIDLLGALNHIDPSISAEVLARNQPTVGNVIDEFLKADIPLHPAFRAFLGKCRNLEFGKKTLAKLRPSDYIDHIRFRRKTVVPATALQDLIAFKIAFVWAHEHRSIDFALDVLERAKRDAFREGLIAKSRIAPVRRLSREDEERLMKEFLRKQADPRARINMVDIVQFALWSGRRRNEICSLRWEDVHAASQMCAVRKRGGRRVRFPLLGKAWEIVNRRQTEPGRHKEYIFPYNTPSVSAAFTLAKRTLKINIVFDDLREEGIRRLLEAKQYPLELIQQLDPKKVLEIQAQLDEGKAL